MTFFHSFVSSCVWLAIFRCFTTLNITFAYLFLLSADPGTEIKLKSPYPNDLKYQFNFFS